MASRNITALHHLHTGGISNCRFQASALLKQTLEPSKIRDKCHSLPSLKSLCPVETQKLETFALFLGTLVVVKIDSSISRNIQIELLVLVRRTRIRPHQMRMHAASAIRSFEVEFQQEMITTVAVLGVCGSYGCIARPAIPATVSVSIDLVGGSNEFANARARAQFIDSSIEMAGLAIGRKHSAPEKVANASLPSLASAKGTQTRAAHRHGNADQY